MLGPPFAARATVRFAGTTASDVMIEAAGARGLRGPDMLAGIAGIPENHPEILPHEQWISVGASLQNVLFAADALGFAVKMVNARRVRVAGK